MTGLGSEAMGSAALAGPAPDRRASGLTAYEDGTSVFNPSSAGDDEALRVPLAHLRNARNPLIGAAAPLLDLILVINEGASHVAPRALKVRAVVELRAFHRRMEQEKVSLQAVRLASYALCSALDEAVLTTEWGASSDWGMETLLWTFHSDSSGGERFFRHLADLVGDSETHVDLIELMTLLIDLGFEGHYRISDNGMHELETLRSRLHEILRSSRAPASSPVGTVSPEALPDPHTWLVWLLLLVCGALLATIIGYAYFQQRTLSLVGPVDMRIERLLDEYRETR